MLDQLGFIEKSLQGQGLTATPRVREGRNNRTEPTRDDTPRRSLFDFVLRHHATVHGPSVHPGVVLISEIIHHMAFHEKGHLCQLCRGMACRPPQSPQHFLHDLCDSSRTFFLHGLNGLSLLCIAPLESLRG